ncbi:MAG TPA: type 4a pilus biogenesis protein PilO [Gemmatimonadaceae bacterium]
MAGLPTNQRDQLMVLLAVIGIAAAGAYWYLVWSPKNVELDARQAHVDSLVTVNETVKREVASGTVTRLTREAEQYGRTLDAMRTLVPTSNEVPVLLDQVSTAARRAGLDLGDVRPGDVVKGDHFDAYRYQISVIGDYNAIGQFLSNVGSLDRIVAPMNVQLSPITGATRKDRARLEARLDLQTYVANAARPQPAARADGKAPSAGGGA